MKRTMSILGIILICGLAAFGHFAREVSVQFSDLRDARSRLAETGFFCTPDKADGSFGAGFLVSRAPATWKSVGAMCKIGQMGPEWQGKAWVTVNSSLFQLQTLPENAGTRTWGKVFAFGDEALLRELDSLVN